MTTDQTPFVLDVVASPPSVWNGQPLTCQTCDVRREQQGDATVTCDSGDCVDGHPIISVDVPCQHCTEGVCGGGRDEGGTRWYCQHCWSEDFQRGTGTRQVRASAQAVPIMACFPVCRGQGRRRRRSQIVTQTTMPSANASITPTTERKSPRPMRSAGLSPSSSRFGLMIHKLASSERNTSRSSSAT